MIGAVRRGAATLLNARQSTQEVTDALTKMTATKREDGELVELAAIEELHAVLQKFEPANLAAEERILHDLVEVAWMSLFEFYYWLKKRD
jgi:hypothetical protein